MSLAETHYPAAPARSTSGRDLSSLTAGEHDRLAEGLTATGEVPAPGLETPGSDATGEG